MNAHVINFIIAATGFGVFNLLCSYTLKKKYTYDIDRKVNIMKSRRKNKKKKAEIKVDEDMLYFYMDDIEYNQFVQEYKKEEMELKITLKDQDIPSFYKLQLFFKKVFEYFQEKSKISRLQEISFLNKDRTNKVPYIRKIHIDMHQVQKLNDACFHYIGQLCLLPPKLTSINLNFSNCKYITNATFKHISDTISLIVNLEEIKLDFSNVVNCFANVPEDYNYEIINLEGAQQLFQNSMQNPNYIANLGDQIQINFQLAPNIVNQNIIKSFVQFYKPQKPLQETDEQYMYIANFITQMLKNNPGLNTIQQIENDQILKGILNYSIEMLANALYNLPDRKTLKTIEFNFSNFLPITDKQFIMLVQAISALPKIQSLSLFFNNCQFLTDQSIDELYNKFYQMEAQIKHLKLSFNSASITSRSVQYFINLIKNQQQIIEFSLDIGNLCDVDIPTRMLAKSTNNLINQKRICKERQLLMGYSLSLKLKLFQKKRKDLIKHIIDELFEKHYDVIFDQFQNKQKIQQNQ